MRVLVACEESQEVCKAFRALGHEAYSCDIEPCSGGHPEWHLQCDALEIIKMRWDLIIAHPPCTYLTNAGNKWFKAEFKERFPDRENQREAAVQFFVAGKLEWFVLRSVEFHRAIWDIWHQLNAEIVG